MGIAVARARANPAGVRNRWRRRVQGVVFRWWPAGTLDHLEGRGRIDRRVKHIDAGASAAPYPVLHEPTPFDGIVTLRKPRPHRESGPALVDGPSAILMSITGVPSIPSSAAATCSWKTSSASGASSSVLRADAIYEDVAFSKTMTAAVRREINDPAHWLELDLRLPA